MVKPEKQIDLEDYVEQTAVLLGVLIPPESRLGVVSNFTRTAAIAQLVLEFPLEDDVEVAPTFEP